MLRIAEMKSVIVCFLTITLTFKSRGHTHTPTLAQFRPILAEVEYIFLFTLRLKECVAHLILPINTPTRLPRAGSLV